MGSSEPLGSPSNFGESTLKVDCDIGVAVGGTPDPTKTQEAGTAGSVCASVGIGSPSEVGNKRKRCMLSEGDIIVLTGMSDAVNNVASAIRETKIEDSHPELYSAIMFMPGFTDEALLTAYNHLLDNKAQGTAFVKMNDSHRVLWLRTYLAKHYYI
ncbi:uncharacterized protein C2845_PM15G01170 [Panicum miliaceum]|uniref:Uncharacterized protein n=1 Tax=Panicum miliaceum TaxID=4540 RepID=A0A3L6Q5R8_PANMI|nr:uncharacterized protein C2845_PM15G01170 [Panicum miliaceum]